MNVFKRAGKKLGKVAQAAKKNPRTTLALLAGGYLAYPFLTGAGEAGAGAAGAAGAAGTGAAGAGALGGWAIPGAMIGSSLLGAYGAQKGADAAEAGAKRAIAEEGRQFDITQANMAPWLEAGKLGLGKLSDLVKGDRSGFQVDPGYQFAMEQGTQAIDRGAAARGMLGSGARLKDLTRFGQGLANQQYGDYWNRLAGLSNVGQTTGTSLGQFGANMAGNIGQAQQNIGQARASGYQGVTDALQGGLNNALFYNMMKPSRQVAGDAYMPGMLQ